MIEVDGRSVGRPLIPKAPLLQLKLSELGGGRIQILNHALSFATGGGKGGGDAGSGDVGGTPAQATLWQLMFPMDGQLAACDTTWSAS